MYKVGDYVVKVNNGICKITDIVHLDNMNVDKNRLYYLMVPNEGEQMKLYVPVDAANNRIRKVITEKEAWDIIDKIPEIESDEIINDKQREQEYKEAIRSCKPELLVGIIKTTYLRKKERNLQGKKSTVVDEHFFKLAEKMLYSELAFALGREQNEIQKLIVEKASAK